MKIGPVCKAPGKWEFTVWAPHVRALTLEVVSPARRTVRLERGPRGYWSVEAEDVHPDTEYVFALEGERQRPDPASHSQPHGVHGASRVVDHSRFRWTDGSWPGVPLEDMVFYELHPGTFTPEGTFAAALSRLDDLVSLGITAVSLMPVAQFPGGRNWGYDGVYPFAVQNSYGGPDGLKQFVDACHGRGLAVVLDVVYNHLGPEGNYFREFAPYFTDIYASPWGDAVNLDQAYCDDVRNFFLENAVHWFENYHLDGLRLDAVHAFYDRSARPFLMELATKVDAISRSCGRELHLIVESDLNDVRILETQEEGGFGLQAQWCDDFHHALHSLLTGESQGYYADFGELSHLFKAYREGYVISWQYSRYRKRHHGSSSRERPARQFIVFSQNHDQVGNRALGERLSALVDFESLKLAAGAVVLSPYLPLLFMGEEYAEEAPFQYFVSHSDPALAESVRKGRTAEFGAFSRDQSPPDPQSPDTFFRSRLNWEKRETGKHAVLLRFYRRLIRLRKETPALIQPDKRRLEVSESQDAVLTWRRWRGQDQAFGVMNFSRERVEARFEMPEGKWRKVLESSASEWLGPGPSLPADIARGQELLLPPRSFSLYVKEGEL
jgi:maltooligosyltrehalose trehalohydrolase